MIPEALGCEYSAFEELGCEVLENKEIGVYRDRDNIIYKVHGSNNSLEFSGCSGFAKEVDGLCKELKDLRV
jgi:hypothetical protein